MASNKNRAAHPNGLERTSPEGTTRQIKTSPPRTDTSSKISKRSLSLPGQDQNYESARRCHLSLAPATQTTVVTTTKTITTSFPEFEIKEPRDLLERDPSRFPLARDTTPKNLTAFTFPVGNNIAYFEEYSPSEQIAGTTSSPSLTKKSSATQRHDYWRHAQRPLGRSFHKSFATDTDSIPHKERYSQTRRQRAKPSSAATSSNQDQALSSDSDPRPAKRPRLRRHGGPSTPVASQSLRRIAGKRRAREDLMEDSPISLAGGNSTSRQQTSFESDLPTSQSNTEHADSQSPNTVTAPPSPPSFVAVPGMVATPPIGDQDINPTDRLDTSKIASEVSTEEPSQTQQDNCLPSPLLSPVTLSANSSPHASGDSEDEEPNNTTALTLYDDERGLAQNGHDGQAQLSTPLGDISTLIDRFDNMPLEMQQYVLFQLFRRSDKRLLQFAADVVNPALKCDFLERLPTELALNVTRYLDAQSLCRAAQVSRRWRQLVDSDDKIWKELITKDGYMLPPGELQRAKREGWKWQGLLDAEVDLRGRLNRPSTPLALPAPGGPPSTPTNRGLKRKASELLESPKRRKTRHLNDGRKSWILTTEEEEEMENIDAEVMTAEAAELGLRSLRVPHLYKAIYRRHHGFRQSWMDKKTEPQHLAFRAHGRHVVTCLQFDDEKILTGSDDTKIHVYNTNTGALQKILHGHEGGVWALQYDGNTLVSGSTDRTVRVWDIEKGRCRFTFHGHTSTVRCLVILKPSVVGHEADGTPIMMPKKPLIITGSRDSSLRIWQLPKLGVVPFNPTGSSITSDEQNPFFVRALHGHTHSVRAIAAHGDTLVSGSYDSTVRVWRISTGETVYRLAGHSQKVYSVILDHERNRCISGSMDNLVKVWSLETGQCIFNLDGHTSLVGLLDLNSGRLVSAAADWTLRVWDPETGNCKSTLSAHTGAITCFQHDSQKVVSGSDRTLKMWNIDTGECVRDLLTDHSGGWQVKFNDRKCVAAVQRRNRTYIEVLDFGAARDGIPAEKRGTRILVDDQGEEIAESSDEDEGDE